MATQSTWSLRRRPWRAFPESLDAADAAPLLCAGITTFNSLRNSGARPGDTVAVQGIGGLGHLAIQYAARMGFRTVAVSSGADKEELARQLGAHEYVDTQRTSAAEGLTRLGGADLVLATAPQPAAIAEHRRWASSRAASSSSWPRPPSRSRSPCWGC